MSEARATQIPYSDKELFYRELLSEIGGLIDPSLIATLANASAAVKHHLPEVNWVGFYLYDGKELVVGPFQGLPACVRIPLNKGVCGAAARERKTFVVDDVHAFPGHIACDAASRSEIVVPLYQGERLLGVFDIDSPRKSRLDEEDQKGLEAIAQKLLSAAIWST